jgi:hypothetical protein
MSTPPEQWPGQWQPGGYGPYQPPPPPPAPPPRRTGRLVAILVVALLVLAGAGVGVYLLVKDDKPASPSSSGGGGSGGGGPQVDDCVKDKSRSANDAELQPIDCASPEAIYRVAKRLDSATAKCPDGDYDVYTETGIGDGLAWCLMLNAKQGDCFVHMTEVNTPTARADCGSAEFKTTKVLNGEAKESACPSEDTVVALVYPEPPTTICLEAI